MVSVKFSHRIICDKHFIEWLRKQSNIGAILNKLMRIKGNSKDWKKTHNVILKSEENFHDHKEQKYFGVAFKVVENPEFLRNYDSDMTKNIIYGISLNDETPFKCYLLTSPEKEESYKNNGHIRGITNFQVISGNEALRIIDEFHRQFLTARADQNPC